MKNKNIYPWYAHVDLIQPLFVKILLCTWIVKLVIWPVVRVMSTWLKPFVQLVNLVNTSLSTALRHVHEAQTKREEFVCTSNPTQHNHTLVSEVINSIDRYVENLFILGFGSRHITFLAYQEKMHYWNGYTYILCNISIRKYYLPFCLLKIFKLFLAP